MDDDGEPRSIARNGEPLRGEAINSQRGEKVKLCSEEVKLKEGFIFAERNGKHQLHSLGLNQRGVLGKKGRFAEGKCKIDEFYLSGCIMFVQSSIIF